MKNSKIFRQYDSRWGSLPYKNKSSVSGAGCGLCSVLHCIIEMDKYKNYTPKSIHSYMRQFAVDNQGTLWDGITKALKHYGLDNVKYHGSMTELWRYLKNGNRVGVVLFGSKTAPDGTVWTTGGHYVAFVDYKVKNGKHYLYMKDSGGRKHDGWYCYETSMKGNVKCIWSAKLPTATKKTYSGTFPTLPSRGYFKKGDKGTQVKYLQKFLNWYGGYGLTVDGNLGDKTVASIKKFQKAEGLTGTGEFGTKSLAKAKKVKR